MTRGGDDLDRYLRILAGATPADRLIEIRAATPAHTMRQTFIAATRPELATATITRLAAHTDVYVGVLLRRHRAGGRAACERSHLAFVEIDQPDARQRLAQHPCPPTIVIASGIIRSRSDDRPRGPGDPCWRHVADVAGRAGSWGWIGP